MVGEAKHKAYRPTNQTQEGTYNDIPPKFQERKGMGREGLGRRRQRIARRIRSLKGKDNVTQKEGKENSEGSLLFFETFPHVGLSKTYSVNFLTADSASTATAIFTGVKTKSETIGFDANVLPYKVDSEKTSKKLTTVMEWAQG